MLHFASSLIFFLLFFQSYRYNKFNFFTSKLFDCLRWLFTLHNCFRATRVYAPLHRTYIAARHLYIYHMWIILGTYRIMLLYHFSRSFPVFIVPRQPSNYGIDVEQRIFCPNLCGRSYKRVEHMKRHISYECGVEPKFQCHVCRHKFVYNFSMKKHINQVHKDIRPWWWWPFFFFSSTLFPIWFEVKKSEKTAWFTSCHSNKLTLTL